MEIHRYPIRNFFPDQIIVDFIYRILSLLFSWWRRRDGWREKEWIKTARDLMESEGWFLMECLCNAGIGVGVHDDVTLERTASIW